jgi:acyl-CoA synthetase (AMP-forming)/AMP-acid ligase II
LQDILLIEAHGRDAARWAQAIAPDQAREKLRRDIDPFAPAAIMYTSGTTGAPKGVVHSQHNIITACAAGSTAGAVAPQARRGVVLPLTITNLMIMGPLYAFWNGKACICGQTVKTAPLVEWLHREQVGSISAVPTMVYDILEADLDLPEGFSTGAGGAPLPEPVRQAYYKRHHKHVLQSYGLTEAPTVVAETRFVEPPEGASGMILPHLSVTIRDADGNILPAGETGEICIAAVSEGPWAGVYTPPLGYWRDPERTEALLKGGVLHTSDLGRFDDAGWLYLADRSSELILRGGSNVYPAEVERVLHGHDGVADCAVVGKPDPRLGMRTVAFIQPAAAAMGDEKLVGELVALCHSALARYKTPDDWVFLHEFPRNAMGKIMKPALRQQLLAGEHGK